MSNEPQSRDDDTMAIPVQGWVPNHGGQQGPDGHSRRRRLLAALIAVLAVVALLVVARPFVWETPGTPWRRRPTPMACRRPAAPTQGRTPG